MARWAVTFFANALAAFLYLFSAARSVFSRRSTVRSTFCAAATLAAGGVDDFPLMAARVKERRLVVERPDPPCPVVFAGGEAFFDRDGFDVPSRPDPYVVRPTLRGVPVLPVDFVVVPLRLLITAVRCVVCRSDTQWRAPPRGRSAGREAGVVPPDRR